jgi:hypothetical protein
LRVTRFVDSVPGPANLVGLVSSDVQVSFAGQAATASGQPPVFTYATNTGWPGTVPIQLLVVRTTRTQVVQGSIHEHNGRWQWTGGGHSVPLAADNPCVTRVWPGGRPMTDREYHVFCRTHIATAPVPPGIVATVNLSYDLSTDSVAGDATGPAGATLTVNGSLGSAGSFSLDFVVDANETRGFTRDIRPLFRPVDVAHMNHAGMDLTSYTEVKLVATQIDRAVRADAASGIRMPPPPDAAWPPGYVLVFTQWMAQGMQP